MSEKIESLLNQAKANSDESSISFAEKTFSDEAQAVGFFSILKTKLSNIKEWNFHATLSNYQLFGANGDNVRSEKMSVGNFIRISLKGSGKYDWVRIIDIYEAADEFIIAVKPTYDPTEEMPDKTVISHFFTADSVNNFCILRKNNTVKFCIIGLNERQNTSETKNALETIRNVGVNFGSYLGIQRGEWEMFCRSLLGDADENAKH